MSHWLHKSVRIAEVETRRQFRQMKEQPAVALLNVLALVVIVPGVVGEVPLPGVGTVGAAPGAYAFGAQLAAGEEAAVLEIGRTASVALFVMGIYLVGMAEIGNEGPQMAIDGLLATVPPRTIAVGRMLVYALFVARLAGVIVLAGAIAFGVGAGSALATGTFLLGGLGALLTAVAITYPVALAGKLAFRRIETLRENKLLFGGPLVVGLFALLLGLRDPASLIQQLPLAWYADLGLLGSVSGTSPLRAVLVTAALPVALIGSALASSRIGEAVWLSDDLQSDTEVSLDREPSNLERFLERTVSPPVAAVTRVTWWRLRREPQVFLFGGLLVVLTASAGITAAERFPNALPYIIAIYGAATVGAGATLNPLGNEGAMLPGTLTVPNGGRHVVAGYAVSASLPGAVLVGAATLAAGAWIGLTTPKLLAVGVLGVALGAAGPVISLGLGVAFPNFDGIDVLDSTNMQAPHLRAVFLYLIGLVALGIPAAAGLSPGAAGELLPLSDAVITAVGVGATVAAAFGVARLSFGYAVNVVGAYELDD